MKGLFGTKLHWMIRQEDRFLVLIPYQEVFDVLLSSCILKVVETQEGLVHVVWIHHIDLRDLFSRDDGFHM